MVVAFTCDSNVSTIFMLDIFEFQHISIKLTMLFSGQSKEK